MNGGEDGLDPKYLVWIVGVVMGLLGWASNKIVALVKGKSDSKLADNDEVQKLIDGYALQLEEQRKITDQYKIQLETVKKELHEQRKKNWKIREEFKEEIANIRAKEDEQQGLIDKLRERYHKLANKFTLLEISSPVMQMPAWVKDAGGVMIQLNDAYEDVYLKPLNASRHDYIGKTDEEFWGEVDPKNGASVGREYMRQDKIAMREGKPVASIDPLVTTSGTSQVYSIKYPITLPGTYLDRDYIVGIAGHTVETELIDSLIKKINANP